MKKIVFILTSLLLGASLLADAQSRGPRQKLTPEQRATRMVEHLHRDLQLTEKQQQDLKLWFTQSYTRQQENFQKYSTEREGMREAIRKDREATEAKLKKVLTAEQYKKYKDIEAKRRQERQQHPSGRPGGPR